MNALIVYGSNYNVAVYCSINYVPKSKKSEVWNNKKICRAIF